jgi:hypothetical protein
VSGGTIFLPITAIERTADAIRLRASLSGSDVDLKWLHGGIRKFLDGGPAVVRSMGNRLLPIAGKLVRLTDNELIASIVETGAAKLVDIGAYGWLALTVRDPGTLNGIVIRGTITGAALADSEVAPFLAKRAGLIKVDPELTLLRAYATEHPQPEVRAWASTRLEIIELAKSASDPLSRWVAEQRIQKILQRSRA